MLQITRREFLSTSAAAAMWSLCRRLTAEDETKSVRRVADAGSLKVTDIQTHEVILPYHDFNAETLFRYHGVGVQLRTIYVVKTNQGLEGYGEAWGRGWPQDEVARYLGTCPFDWIGDTSTLPINMAMYDLMGKFLDLPAWKLIGRKIRDRIPVAGWTVSQPPTRMVQEVKHAADQGFHWLKYHVDEVQNVIEQTKAMQDVAPPNFKIHYDFNANASFGAVEPIIKKLEKFPVVGRIEDPIVAKDVEGWRKIRAMTDIPILVHHGPLEFLITGVVDGLIAGHAAIGEAAKVAAIAETVGLPIMLQQCGGIINQAFLSHEVATFKAATIDNSSLLRLWKDDVTRETMPIDDGHVNVPNGPGLGVTLDQKKLLKYAKVPRPQQKQFLVRIRYEDGPTIFCRHDPDKPGATDSMRYIARLLGPNPPGPVPSYDNRVITDFWDDDGSQDFQQLWRSTEQNPVVR